MIKKIKRFFDLYIWLVLPFLGIMTVLEDFYPDVIPFDIDTYIAIIAILVFISMFVSFYSAFKGLCKHLFSGSKRNKILKTGRAAKAKILNLKESDDGVVTVNDQPFITLELEIEDGASKYNTELKTIIARLDVPKLQPGKVIAVKIDSSDKMKVVIDPEGEIFKK